MLNCTKMPRKESDEYSDEIRRRSEPKGGKLSPVDTGKKKVVAMSNKRKGTDNLSSYSLLS